VELSTAVQRPAAAASRSGTERYFATEFRDVEAEFVLIILFQVSRVKVTFVLSDGSEGT